MRLVGGDFENEGTVEVCIDNIWSLVSDNIWNVANAMVVCNQLGYTGGSKLRQKNAITLTFTIINRACCPY